MLNRCLVTVKAKEPFREWLLSLPHPCGETIEEINDDPSAYLLLHLFFVNRITKKLDRNRGASSLILFQVEYRD